MGGKYWRGRLRRRLWILWMRLCTLRVMGYASRHVYDAALRLGSSMGVPGDVARTGGYLSTASHFYGV
jgi:hypothetical protein